MRYLCIMHDKKFIIIVKTLSIGECKRLTTFVNSPFFNKNDNLVKLWTFIQKYAPDFEHPKFTDLHAFNALFPKDKYRPEVITKLLSKLFDLLKTFIAHYGLDEHEQPHQSAHDKFKETLRLIDFYTKRLPQYAQSAIAKAEQMRDELPLRDMTYYFNDFRLATLRSAYLSNIQDKQDSGLKDALQKSEIHYFMTQLYLACLAVNQRGIANLDTDLAFIDDLLHRIARHSYYLSIPPLAIWYECLMMLTQNDKKTHYQQIKNYLPACSRLFTPEDTRIIYTFLENNAKKISPNDHEFYSELFELYDTQLRQGLINFFQPSLFKNMVVVALRLERFDWIKSLLDSRQNDMVLQYRDAVHQYIEVHLLFKQQKFEAALTALSRTDYGIDLFFKLDARRMHLKIFYELDYNSAFYDLINSFRKFLTDHKQLIADYHIQANRNFITLISRSYQLNKSDKKTTQKLQDDIYELTAQQLPEKDWLLSKL